MIDTQLSNEQMICFCTALPSEAKPLIDYYRLKKIESKPFSVFQRDNVWLIVSGIGALSTAMAVSWLSALTKPINMANMVWLNVGCAGHAELPLGTIARVSEVRGQVREQANGTLYPVMLAAWKHLDAPLQTVSVVAEQYPNGALVDMEGVTFFQAATKCVQSERVQLIKVVSDNVEHPASEVTAAGVSALLEPHCAVIDRYARSMLDMFDSNAVHRCEALLPESIHCTVSQKHQFFRLVQQLSAIGVGPNDWSFELNSYKTMKLLLLDLEAHVKQYTPVI